MSLFRNRSDAGRRLAQHLVQKLPPSAPAVVLGVPRGGVIVAEPVAIALGAPLDVIIPRKLGAPSEPELAVGAIALADGEEIVVLDRPILSRLDVPRKYLDEEAARQRREIERRTAAYREGRAEVPLGGRIAVIVDDGIATGMTVRAAAQAVARLGPAEVWIAAPVAPADTRREFEELGLRLEVLETPQPFMAVGQFYADFEPVEDDEVVAVLRRTRRV